MFGLLVVDMLIGAPLQLNAVFGYSPTVGGPLRRDGQPRYGQLFPGGRASCSAGSCSRRLPGPALATVRLLAVLVVAILIDGMPMWGSDVGGVLAFVPAVGG